MKLLVRGPVDTVTGYGNDVVGLIQALLDFGVQVHLWPTSLQPPVPRRVLALLDQPIAPPYDAVLLYEQPRNLLGVEQYCDVARAVLGWTMWERTPVTPAALGLASEPEGRPFAALDTLVVTCPMNVEAFRAVDDVVPIEVIPPGLDVEAFPQVRRGLRGPVVFGANMVVSSRKDPYALLAAWRDFRERWPELDARLELKTIPPGLHPRVTDVYPDVVLHQAVWSVDQVRDWYSLLDVFVSAARGEGMNKPAVEAMATGLPVVATRWGGHANWQSAQHGYPVAHRLADSPLERGTLDGPVVHDSLVTALHTAATDGMTRLAKGNAAAAFVRSALSWQHAVEHLLRVASKHL
ncbi:glycosyltransferase family 4 protein [Actinosynnema sp. NPDC059335]|uniref:glycosyltransferase family 4 protein n=1 Tax=Actinosynnema sp. NPDC059335 TaxID=3346804 RepID=UPI0036708559